MKLLGKDKEVVPPVFSCLSLFQFLQFFNSIQKAYGRDHSQCFLCFLYVLLPRWSSKVNCQQYARLLIEFGLGLPWPADIDVTGDVAPEIVNIGFFYQSCVTRSYDKSSNNTHQQ